MTQFKGLVKQCEVCSTEFKVRQSQAYIRTCSTACGYKVRLVANKVEKLVCVCKHCRIEFRELPCHAIRRVYCSVKCVQAAKQLKAARRLRLSLGQ